MVNISKAKQAGLNVEMLKDILSYDATTGIFTWAKSRGNGIKKGDRAGCLEGSGYIGIKINNVIYKAHRLAWLYFYGVWPPHFLDHPNRIKTDNRIINLRESDDVDNQRNCNLRIDNTSGLAGVHWNKAEGKWKASITVSSKILHLGTHADKFEAFCSRLSANNKYGFSASHGREVVK